MRSASATTSSSSSLGKLRGAPFEAVVTSVVDAAADDAFVDNAEADDDNAEADDDAEADEAECIVAYDAADDDEAEGTDSAIDSADGGGRGGSIGSGAGGARNAARGSGRGCAANFTAAIPSKRCGGSAANVMGGAYGLEPPIVAKGMAKPTVPTAPAPPLLPDVMLRKSVKFVESNSSTPMPPPSFEELLLSSSSSLLAIASARTMGFGVRFDFRRFGDGAARARRGFARGASDAAGFALVFALTRDARGALRRFTVGSRVFDAGTVPGAKLSGLLTVCAKRSYARAASDSITK